MKKNIIVSENGNLIMSKSFYKKAHIFGTPEYYELRQAQAENEDAEIIFQCDHAKKTTYGGLTFETMAAYISTQPSSVERLMEFEVVKRIAAIKGSKYPLTKKWFLLTYPEYKVSAVSESEKATTLAEMKAKAATEAQKKVALLSPKTTEPAQPLAPAANF